jgi:hypothetical protein
VGATVEFDYVMQELKQPTPTSSGEETHVSCPVEIRIEPLPETDDHADPHHSFLPSANRMDVLELSPHPILRRHDG